jgi:hypothetical protein
MDFMMATVRERKGGAAVKEVARAVRRHEWDACGAARAYCTMDFALEVFCLGDLRASRVRVGTRM